MALLVLNLTLAIRSNLLASFPSLACSFFTCYLSLPLPCLSLHCSLNSVTQLTEQNSLVSAGLKGSHTTTLDPSFSVPGTRSVLGWP